MTPLHLSKIESLSIILFCLVSLQPACFAFTKDFNKIFVAYNFLLCLLICIVICTTIKKKEYEKALGFLLIEIIIILISYYEWYY